MINWKAVGISVAAWLLLFKLNNVMPTSLPLPILFLIIGLSIVFVYLSRIIIRVEKDELLFSAAAVSGIILLMIKFVQPSVLGITNVPKLIQIPGMQGILDFLVVDILGIPSWAIWVTFIALILFILINPLLGFGLALILAGVIIFIGSWWAGVTIPAAVISGGLGLLMTIIGITRSGKRGGSRFVSQPVINIYDMDQPGPMIAGPARRSGDWFWGKS